MTEPTKIETLYLQWLAMENEREAILAVDINDPRANDELGKRAIEAANRVTSAPITSDRDALFKLAVEASLNGLVTLAEPTEATENFLAVFKAAAIPLRASAYPPRSETEKLYHQWLIAEHIATAMEENGDGPLTAKADRLWTEIQAAPVTNERDAMHVLAVHCGGSNIYDDDPRPAPPGTVAHLFEALCIPLRNR